MIMIIMIPVTVTYSTIFVSQSLLYVYAVIALISSFCHPSALFILFVKYIRRGSNRYFVFFATAMWCIYYLKARIKVQVCC